MAYVRANGNVVERIESPPDTLSNPSGRLTHNGLDAYRTMGRRVGLHCIFEVLILELLRLQG